MDIQHDEEASRFFVSKDNVEADLKYSLADNLMDIVSTFTPPELRGQGLAGQITKAALDYARSKGFKVKPSCPYVENYIQKHSEYQDLL